MKKSMLSCVLCGLTACASLRLAPGEERAAIGVTEEDCRSYDSAYTTWGAIGAGAGFLAGAGGISAAFPSEQSSRAVIGTVSLAVGTLSAVAVFLAGNNGNKYTERCTTPAPTAPRVDPTKPRADRRGSEGVLLSNGLRSSQGAIAPSAMVSGGEEAAGAREDALERGLPEQGM